VWQAYVAAGKPAWFDVNAAMLASDDPDRYDRDKTDHVYHVATSYGGAPHAVANLYSRVLAQYKAGDYKGASHNLGLLSHYYSDAAVPFHTARPSARREYDTLHGPYETAVKTLAREKNHTLFLQLRGRQSFTNVRSKTISTAKTSNKQLDTICDNWSKGGIDNAAVRAATKVALSEAVNGYADIIAAVPGGKGLGPEPASYKVLKPWRRYVGKNKNAWTLAKVVDKNGKPIRGVKVTFKVELAAGTKKHVRYTDSDGYAKCFMNTGDQRYYRPFYSSASIQTASGTLASKRTWFMTTPRLAKGKAGFRNTLSTKRPKQKSYVTAKARAISTKGKPVPNLKVKFLWYHKSGTVVTYAKTNSKGIAKSKRYIGKSKIGYKVVVRAKTQAGSYNRQSTTSFTPVKR
jgi:hypothetical protein